MVRMAWYDTAQLPIIEAAEARGDWFTAIVLCATQIEYNGCVKIKEHLTSLKVDTDLADAVLEPLYLRDVVECLLVMKVIDKKERGTILRINKARNDFVHRRENVKFKRGKEAEEEYQPLVEEAKRILREKLDVMRLFVGKG